MRRISIALVTLLAFACATVRVPVATPDQPAEPAGAIAPPMLELWLESSDPVPEQERAQAEQAARAALDSALRGLRVSPAALGAADPVLFVRERAVGLTDARRSQQTWAKVGIVVGIVVVVAVVVIAIVAGSKSGNSPKVAAPHGAAPVAHAASGIAVRPRIAPAVGPPSLAPVVTPGIGQARHVPGWYRPRIYGPEVPFFFWFDFWIPPRPVVLLPEPGDDAEPPYFAPDEPVSPLAENEAPPEPEAQAPEPPPPPPPPEMQLPPLSEAAGFPIRDRSFFAGPRTALQVDLLDRATGKAIWTRAVANDTNPLDAAAVAKLLDDALEGQEWAR